MMPSRERERIKGHTVQLVAATAQHTKLPQCQTDTDRPGGYVSLSRALAYISCQLPSSAGSPKTRQKSRIGDGGFRGAEQPLLETRCARTPSRSSWQTRVPGHLALLDAGGPVLFDATGSCAAQGHDERCLRPRSTRSSRCRSVSGPMVQPLLMVRKAVGRKQISGWVRWWCR